MTTRAGAQLRGMTWNHPRGYEPLVACSNTWQKQTGVEILWDKRSLQDFESYPLKQLAQQYDLIVMDHPHVGQIAEEGCIQPFDEPAREEERAALAEASVGPSYLSYRWRSHQWALPIDAAAQVLAWQPSLIQAPPATWEQVIELAKLGRVLCPMQPPHSLMLLYTLTANLGMPCGREGGELISEKGGREAYELIGLLCAHQDPACFAMDPIAVLDEMSGTQTKISCSPLIYGYVSYSQQGFRPLSVFFNDMPVAGSDGPIGSALGGTGIAVSAYSARIEHAQAFAYWVASGAVQQRIYAAAGGQPGHAEAWSSGEVNARVADFYRSTRSTLDGAWVRPRHNGYMPFQHWAAERLNHGWKTREPATEVLTEINSAYRNSFLRE